MDTLFTVKVCMQIKIVGIWQNNNNEWLEIIEVREISGDSIYVHLANGENCIRSPYSAQKFS